MADALGLSLAEFERIDYEHAVERLSYDEGKALAQWVAENPRSKHGTS